MKYKKSKIKSEIIEVNNVNKISYSNNYPENRWHPEYDIFCKVYKDLINEWANNLYVPYEFLQDIIRNIYGSSFNKLIRYKLRDVLNVSTINWKYYEKFKKDVKRFDENRFNVFILFFKGSVIDVEKRLKAANFSQSTIDAIKSNLHLKAFCMMSNELNDGCIVVLNGFQINSHNSNQLEQELDHELNHYFSKFDENETTKDIELNERIEKIGNDAGYDLSNEFVRQDFIAHILDKSEFRPMIANVCNILQFQLNSNDKYSWLINHSTTNFLKTNEYRNLTRDLQNILLFTTICRIYSSKRWNELKEDLKIQFDKKESLSEKVKSSLMTLIERLKRWC